MDESKAQTHSSDHDEWANVKIRHAYHELPGHFYSAVTPSPLDNPAWVHWNADMAQQLGLPRIASPQLLQQFAGKNAHPYLKPIATKYVGHQFGYYNPDLGDGRGLLLGELYHQTEKQWYEMHVKGSGPTPYSRGADGRAVLRSSIREYLISEALHHLGIPTTRALGLITSETQVYRDGIENGAICIRLAPSHIRFGHFEHFYQQKDHDGLKALLDFCIAHYFPECQKAQVPYAAFFKTVCDKTAELIANWQAFGFAHGVLNTDNMSILSLSFDFGPFAFLDGYQSDFICNHSDSQGRYSFANQPAIGQWNLQVLAQALS
ncbi:MAG: protein adenylyltransferase SelO family protein, partial [Vibrio sp.]